MHPLDQRVGRDDVGGVLVDAVYGRVVADSGKQIRVGLTAGQDGLQTVDESELADVGDRGENGVHALRVVGAERPGV